MRREGAAEALEREPAAGPEGLPLAARREELEAWAPRVLRQARARVHHPTDRWEMGQLTPFQIPHLQQAL
jgi:hypothetical protein